MLDKFFNKEKPFTGFGGFGGGGLGLLGGAVAEPFSGTGGTEYTPGNGYKYHVFYSAPGAAVTGTFTATGGYESSEDLEVLVVGGGACNIGPYQGGGGAGGVIRTPFPITGPSSYPVSVAASRTTRGQGGNTRIDGHPLGTLLALGGGLGGQYSAPQSGAPGGSGGGVQDSPGAVGNGTQPAQNPQWTPLTGFNQYGNPGGDGLTIGAYQSGGGGGAGEAGGIATGPAGSVSGGYGGNGIAMPGFEYPLVGLSAIDNEFNASSPTSNHYGGGGSGWGYAVQSDPTRFKAAGGGGKGSSNAPGSYTTPGINGLGGGGGGNVGSGGSGIIIFRYPVQ